MWSFKCKAARDGASLAVWSDEKLTNWWAGILFSIYLAPLKLLVIQLKGPESSLFQELLSWRPGMLPPQQQWIKRPLFLSCNYSHTGYYWADQPDFYRYTVYALPNNGTNVLNKYVVAIVCLLPLRSLGFSIISLSAVVPVHLFHHLLICLHTHTPPPVPPTFAPSFSPCLQSPLSAVPPIPQCGCGEANEKSDWKAPNRCLFLERGVADCLIPRRNKMDPFPIYN